MTRPKQLTVDATPRFFHHLVIAAASKSRFACANLDRARILVFGGPFVSLVSSIIMNSLGALLFLFSPGRILI